MDIVTSVEEFSSFQGKKYARGLVSFLPEDIEVRLSFVFLQLIEIFVYHTRRTR
jgi:hypothetical protein